MKDRDKQSDKDLERLKGKRAPRRDPDLCAQTTERWFFYPNAREHPDYAQERARQDRSLQEFS
jgi:hypothetical protein